MKEFDQIEYKGYLINKFEHPQLSGRYEIHKNEDSFKFICRTLTIKEAKEAINVHIKNEDRDI